MAPQRIARDFRTVFILAVAGVLVAGFATVLIQNLRYRAAVNRLHDQIRSHLGERGVCALSLGGVNTHALTPLSSLHDPVRGDYQVQSVYGEWPVMITGMKLENFRPESGNAVRFELKLTYAPFEASAWKGGPGSVTRRISLRGSLDEQGVLLDCDVLIE